MPPRERPEAQRGALLARRRSLFWRLHFWAALIATPFALVAALTGVLYIFTPQIEERLYGGLDQVRPASAILPLDQLVAAANARAPAGLALQAVLPPAGPRDSARLRYVPADAVAGGHAGHEGMARPAPSRGPAAQPSVVYVDPYSARVLGVLPESQRFNVWAKHLHSRLLQGQGWRWMIELAASWLMVMLLTGVYLLWPGGGRRALPQARARGRRAWVQWHGFLGVALGAVSLVILTTGLTWSQLAGEQIRAARDWSGQASPRPPAQLRSTPAGAALGWQQAWDIARREAPAVALQLTAPKGPQGVWRASAVDRSRPGLRYDLVFDAYSGRRLYYSDWQRETAFGKATALGIPFHRGEFGGWNQAVLLLFGVGVLFSLLSGWTMFLKRRKPGAAWLPPLAPGAWRAAPPLAWLAALALCVAMPLLALSSALLVLVEMALLAAPARASRAGT